MDKKDFKLYNMILPPFMLFAFVPMLWLISLIGNFIIDSIVLILLVLIFYKRMNWQFYKNLILKIWVLGFVADILGVVYLLSVSLGANAEYSESNDLGKQILSGIYLATNQSHFDSFWGVMFILSGIFVSSAFIFIFNYFIVFQNTDMIKKQKLLFALCLAILTAPYTFLLPWNLFY